MFMGSLGIHGNPFKVVVCSANYFRPGEGIILWYTGDIIRQLIADYGNSAGECGFDLEETGIFVFDGSFFWETDNNGMYTYPDGGWVFRGECRSPTDEEWALIKQNRNPFEVDEQ